MKEHEKEIIKIFDDRYKEIIDEVIEGVNQTRRRYLSAREEELKLLKRLFEEEMENADS